MPRPKPPKFPPKSNRRQVPRGQKQQGKTRRRPRKPPELARAEKMAEAMLIEGVLPYAEIARRSGLTQQRARMVRFNLKERGTITRIPRSSLPPVTVARLVLRQEVLMQLSGKTFYYCDLRAEAPEGTSVLRKWLSRNPKIFWEVRTVNGGSYWGTALRQLRGEGWIERMELEYLKHGKKFDPSISLIDRFIRERQRKKKK